MASPWRTRLKGSSEEAYEQYEQIVKELQELMDNDLKFTPKQRRDLRDRLINSLERRADVWFFASQHDDLARRGRGPSRIRGATPDARRGRASTRPRRSWQDFQEAIELVGNDDLSIKTRLLYKKVIARFAGRAGAQVAGPSRRARGPG